MTNKLICLVAMIAVVASSATLLAQESKPAKAAEGTLMVDGKNYPVTHALAYETTLNDEQVIAVVLSAQAIFNDKLKEAMKKDGEQVEFKRPYLRLQFTKAGELKLWNAS